jgi:hypothetical protein
MKRAIQNVTMLGAMVGLGVLAVAGCSQPLSANPDASTQVTPDMSQTSHHDGPVASVDHKIPPDLGQGTSSTIMGLRTSGTTSTNYTLTGAVIVVTQGSAGKWKGYVQDNGMADGAELYCYATSSTPCGFAGAPPAAGTVVTMTATWSPYNGVDQMIPVSITMTGSGAAITYATNVAGTALGSTSTAATYYGAPVKLDPSTGPWMVSNTMVSTELNSKYAAMCAKGPQYYGVQVTSGSTSFIVTADWYSTVTFTTDATCSSQAPNTVLTTTSKFTTLGGIVESGKSSTVQLEPFNPADYTLQ